MPPAGETVEATDEAATGSTVTEVTASEKTGRGKPALGLNPGNAALDRVRVDSSDRVLTTNQGVAVAENQSSLKAGLRGPALLEDFILREKITHFDHERIPERIVHARGSAAHGYFECYESLAHYTRASLFAEAGKRTPVFVRFHRRRRARIDGHGARRARLRREVLHRRRQLGPRGKQYSRVLHPGRDEVSRPYTRGQARAALRRQRRTIPSGTSYRSCLSPPTC
jgi:catalase